MRRRSRHATRYSAKNSLSRPSLPGLPARCDHASCSFFQCGRATYGSGELAFDLRPRLRRVTGRESVEHFTKTLLGQVLIGILPDQDHRCVYTSSQALDLFPTKVAVLGQVKW